MTRRAPTSRLGLSPFVVTIWGLGLLLAGYLAVWPQVENAIARYTWKEQPCFLDGQGPGKGHFIYKMAGTTYIRGRKSFWDSRHDEQQFTTDVWDGTPNGTCWINPSDPGDSVRALTGLSDPLARKALISGAVVLAMCPIITWFAHRRVRCAAAQLAPAETAVSAAGTDAPPDAAAASATLRAGDAP